LNLSGFFDESGKFNDHKVVAIGCVASYNQHVDDFAREWGRLLYLNGLDELHANKAFQHKRRLSKKVDAFGLKPDRRIIAVCRMHPKVFVGHRWMRS